MARYVLTPSHTYGHDLLRRLLPAILALVLPPFARVLQARIKTFGKAVLPRAAWRDVGGLPRRFVQELAEAFGRDRRVMTPASVKKRPAHASFAQCCPGCCPTTISRNVRVRKRFITH